LLDRRRDRRLLQMSGPRGVRRPIAPNRPLRCGKAVEVLLVGRGIGIFCDVFRTTWLLVFGIVLVMSGCQARENVREWRASDHGQPEATQIDPSRLPAGDESEAEETDPRERGARAAASLWRVVCAGCHGPGGQGGGPNLPPNAQARDLTDAAWQQGTTDEAIAQVIVQGRGMMPAFGNQLGEAGVRALVAHVRSLKAQ
jgi:mono/diheme cytochrome c family protein